MLKIIRIKLSDIFKKRPPTTSSKILNEGSSHTGGDVYYGIVIKTESNVEYNQPKHPFSLLQRPV